jgi:hypothetical protein
MENDTHLIFFIDDQIIAKYYFFSSIFCYKNPSNCIKTVDAYLIPSKNEQNGTLCFEIKEIKNYHDTI